MVHSFTATVRHAPVDQQPLPPSIDKKLKRQCQTSGQYSDSGEKALSKQYTCKSSRRRHKTTQL